jgi:hypothetical protein
MMSAALQWEGSSVTVPSAFCTLRLWTYQGSTFVTEGSLKDAARVVQLSSVRRGGKYSLSCSSTLTGANHRRNGFGIASPTVKPLSLHLLVRITYEAAVTWMGRVWPSQCSQGQ